MFKNSEDAIQIFTLPSPSFKLANTVTSALDKKKVKYCARQSFVLNKQFKKSLVTAHLHSKIPPSWRNTALFAVSPPPLLFCQGLAIAPHMAHVSNKELPSYSSFRLWPTPQDSSSTSPVISSPSRTLRLPALLHCGPPRSSSNNVFRNVGPLHSARGISHHCHQMWKRAFFTHIVVVKKHLFT